MSDEACSCAVCTDVFRTSQVILTPGRCGHIFHKECLEGWFKTKKTCPECRAKATQAPIRIFMTGTFSGPDPQDRPESLKATVEEHKKIIEEHKKIIEALTDKVQDQQKNLVEIAKLKAKAEMFKSHLAAANAEIQQLRSWNSDFDHLKQQLDKARARLSALEELNQLWESDARTRDELCREYSKPEVLAQYCLALKRDLKAVTEKNRLTQARMNNESHKKDLEIRELKERLKQFEERATKPAENPTPKKPERAPMRMPHMRIPLKDTQSTSNVASSDSPYLQVKASNVGLAPLIRKLPAPEQHLGAKRAALGDLCIMKKRRLDLLNPSSVSAEPNRTTEKALTMLAGTTVKKIKFTRNPSGMNLAPKPSKEAPKVTEVIEIN